MFLRRLLMPPYTLRSSLGVPFLPFFVVMITTPLAPLEPEMAAEVASFCMPMDSRSFGLIKFSGLEDWVALRATAFPVGLVLAPCKGTPFTTNKGWLPDLTEEMPLILKVTSPPGAP